MKRQNGDCRHTCVRNDRDTGVCAERILVHPVLIVRLESKKRRLRRLKCESNGLHVCKLLKPSAVVSAHQQIVHFVVSALVPRVNRNAHRLLAHLALINVARRLIVIGKWNEIAGEAEQGGRMKLLMHGDARLRLVWIDDD